MTATLQGTAGGRLPPRIECQLAVPYGRIMRILKWNVVLTPQRIAQARDWANLNCGTGNN